MWFKTLTGFAEESPEKVHANITVDRARLTSNVNGKRCICGDLETPSLAELRKRAGPSKHGSGKMTVREVVANIQHLLADEMNAGSLFQVASQFNLLEMMSPSVTPEQGVGIYENDRTQGPACAIAAGAGTIYRNYFVPVNGQVGQSQRLSPQGAAVPDHPAPGLEKKYGRVIHSLSAAVVRNGQRVDVAAVGSSMRLTLVARSDLDSLRGRRKTGMDLNLENTKGFPLGEEFQEKLLTGARECVMSWSTSEGWPMAICHIFLWHKGRIWTTTSGHKKRVKALRKRPMSCIVISGEGNEVGGERSVSIKTRVTFREDQATRDWFYPAIAAKENPDDPDRAKAFVGLLDSPNRVILEHKPVKFISYDGIAMRDALVAEFTRRLDVGAGESV